jgi:hypothetical protein
MRLLHTREDRFQEFQIRADNHGQRGNPKYAILSHRWGNDEVLYQEFLWLISKDQQAGPQKLNFVSHIGIDESKKNGAGFAKIQNFRRLANLVGYDWVWIDTCCIDKSSSAELSEAINSMFVWYQQSHVCWAYLNDVQPTPRQGGPVVVSASRITDSKWFTRGWTLQELIAPGEVIFYDAHWNEVGSKRSLADAISARTTIKDEVLEEPDNRYKIPVATRMKWAAGRETTRIEDRAYSLLGVFDVNLPLIYGEGDKAFLRLQEEIVRTSSDTSVFLHDSWRDIFAQGPDNFANTSPQSCIKVFQANFYRVSSVMEQISPRSFTKTNFGLHMNAMTVPVPLNAELYNIRLVLLETLHISPPRPHYLIVRHLHDQGVLRDPAINDKTWASLGNSIEGWTVMTVKQRKEAVEKVFERWDAWCRSVLAGGPKVEFDLDNWCERLNMTISVD